MKKFYLIILFAFLASFGSYITAAEKTITYTFTTKDWNATDQKGNAANWVSGGSASSTLDKTKGIPVYKAETGANATSPISFNNIKKVVLTWGTSGSGAGYIVLTVGGTDQTAKKVSTSKTDQSYAVTFDTPVNGNVKFTVNCTKSTIFIKSVAVTYEEAAADQVAAPVADPKPGTYNVDTTVKFTSPEGTIVRVKLGDEYFTPVKNIFTKELTAVNGEKTTYKFEVWTEYNDNNSVRVFYTYIIDPNAKNDIFARINKVEHFAANDEVIIVSEKAGMIMSTYGSSAFNGKSDSVEGSYTIPFGDNEISILTIENGATPGTYKLKCADGEYLNLSTSGANITTTTKGSDNKISFKVKENNVYIRNNDTRSIAWRAGSTKLFKHYSDNNINDSEYYHVQLYKKLTGDGNLTARLRSHENNEVIDAEENVADGMTYQNIGAILLSSETAVNYALVGEDGTQIGTTEPGKTSVLTFPGVGKYILATSNKVISFSIGSVVSGVETIAADAAKVYGANGNIVVEAEAAADVNVYNAAGMLVAAQKVGAGRTNIALAKGFYVVRAGNTVTKVAVR